MRIVDAKATTKGTPVVFTSGDFKGLHGAFEYAGRREGLVRVCAVVPWQPFMGQPRGARSVWVRPSEVERTGNSNAGTS